MNDRNAQYISLACCVLLDMDKNQATTKVSYSIACFGQSWYIFHLFVLTWCQVRKPIKMFFHMKIRLTFLLGECLLQFQNRLNPVHNTYWYRVAKSLIFHIKIRLTCLRSTDDRMPLNICLPHGLGQCGAALVRLLRCRGLQPTRHQVSEERRPKYYERVHLIVSCSIRKKM